MWLCGSVPPKKTVARSLPELWVRHAWLAELGGWGIVQTSEFPLRTECFPWSFCTVIGRLVDKKPRVATEERASALLEELAQVRTALARAETQSDERQLALENRDQDVGLMRIQLRARDVRIAALEKEISDLGALTRRNEQSGELQRESAFLTQMRAALAEAEQRSEERRVALESRNQEVGWMRIQLRVRDARIAALDHGVSGADRALARSSEQIDGAKSDTAAFRNDNIPTLTATVAERDASIAALKARQLAESEALAALQSDYARAIANTEVQRQNLDTLEAALVTANARRAEEQAATRAALEARNSMELAIGEQHQRVARLEAELAGVVRDRDASAAAAAAVQTELLEQSARLAKASARASELEGEALDQVHANTALQEDARVSLEIVRALEAALHAAEASVQRLEADLRIKSAHVDEPAETHDNASSTGATHEEFPEGDEPLFIRTDESEVVHVLGPKTTIGRTPDNDVQIDAQYISRHHAIILSGPTDTIIEDLNSTNGLLVNGRRVRRQTLKDGDIVRVGDVPFRFAAPREQATLKARA
jgi:FHA domain